MAVTNDFQPFAYGGAANVLTQAQYLALTSLLQNGFSSGVANSQQLNKVWRQSSIMAAVLAQFIVDETGLNATDDGTTATLLANLKTAVDQVARIRLASPPAIGNTVAAPSIASVNVSTGQLATPGAATGTGSTTGGTLAAATYYVKIVAVDALGGVTAAGAESVGVTTTGTTSSIAYTWTAVTNAASYQIWYGTAAGAESAYYTSATNNFTLTATSGTAGTLPTANTTGGMSSAGTVTVAPATQSGHAPQMGQVTGVVGSVRNLVMSVTAASLSATLTADEIVVETALGGIRYCLANFNQTINMGTLGAGGLDAGSPIGNGYVALYAIYNPTTKTAALLATNAATLRPNVYGGANMPAGYTASALLSVWPTNAGGQFATGVQRDRRISISQATALAATSTQQSSITALSISSVVPPNAVSISGAQQIGSSTNAVSTGTLYPTSIGIGNEVVSANIPGAGSIITTFRDLFLMTAQTVYYTATATVGTMSYAIFITGYSI